MNASVNPEIEAAVKKALSDVDSILDYHYRANILPAHKGLKEYKLVIYPDGRVYIGDLTDWGVNYAVINGIGWNTFQLIKKAFEEDKVNDFRSLFA